MVAKFSSRLRELRSSKDLSQQKLADMIRTSKSSINMYERGEREPGLEMLETLADFFNVDLDYLLGKSDIPNKYLAFSENSTNSLSSDIINPGITGASKSQFLQKSSLNTPEEIEEDIVIYHRNGETTKKRLSREKMNMFLKMMEAFDDYDDNL